MSTERTVVHEHKGDRLESVLVLPEGPGPFPGLLLLHEFTGLNETTLGYARLLQRHGFAVLAADFYGAGKRPQDLEEARTAHRVFRDHRPTMRARALACLHALINCPEVSPAPPSVLGLSFGGGAALELARSGAPLRTVVSIYGYLDTTQPAESPITADVHILHVTDDPVVPEAHLMQFREEMEAVGTSFGLNRLNGVNHGFMNPTDTAYAADDAEAAWEMVVQRLGR